MAHCIYRGTTGYNSQMIIVFMSLEIVFVLANSVDPDEMPLYAVFHQGLHCLPKYALRGNWYMPVYKGLMYQRK